MLDMEAQNPEGCGDRNADLKVFGDVIHMIRDSEARLVIFRQ